MRERLESLLERYSDIIASVEEFSLVERPGVAILRLKLNLRDASTLYIREIWVRGRLEAYSYYRIVEGEVSEGWNNARHHPDIRTFPHHKHVGGRVEPLETPSLEAFLEAVRRALEDQAGEVRDRS